jgi:hypothetical protein
MGQATIPDLEIRKPLPETVQITPGFVDKQWKGPAPVELPYGRLTALSAGLPMHRGPTHFLSLPVGDKVTDSGGVMVWQSAWCRLT